MKVTASSVRSTFPAAMAVLLLMLASSGLFAQQQPLPGVRLAWQYSVPMRGVGRITSWTLLDGRIYALGEDAMVRVVRADTGEPIWSKILGERFARIWAPTGYQSATDKGVLFTTVDSAVLLDGELGTELKRVRFPAPALAAADGADGYVYVATPDRRLRCVRVADSVQLWQNSSPAPLDLSPLCVRTIDPNADSEQILVLFADTGRMVAGVWGGREHKKFFAHNVEGRAIGWLAADDSTAFVTTANGYLHAIDLDTGDLLWDFRLSGAAASAGPLVTSTSVYQQMANNVLQRVSKDRTGQNWLLRNAAQFLAEWEDQVAVRQPDGRVALIQLSTGEPVGFFEAGNVTGGISNTRNAAILVHGPRGELKCFLPADHPRLSMADFQPLVQSLATQTAPSDDATEPQGTAEPSAAEPTRPAPRPVRPEDSLLRDPLRRQ